MHAKSALVDPPAEESISSASDSNDLDLSVEGHDLSRELKFVAPLSEDLNQSDRQLVDVVPLSTGLSSDCVVEDSNKLSTIDKTSVDEAQSHEVSIDSQRDPMSTPDAASAETDERSPAGDVLQEMHQTVAISEQQPTPDVFMQIDGLPYDFDVFNRGKTLVYHGVPPIEPGPQLNDPPRPSRVIRHHPADSAVGGGNRGVFEGLDLDFESGFALGDEGMSMAAGLDFGVAHEDMPIGRISALDRLVEDVTSHHPALSVRRSVEGFRIEAVTPGVQATRLSFPMEIQPRKPDNTNATQPTDLVVHSPPPEHPISRTASVSSIPPLPPPKDNIRMREELIKAKKREARRREEGDLGSMTQFHVRESSPSHSRSRSRSPARGKLGLGRPSRRRSMSTGDAEDLLATRPGAAMRRASALRGEALLDVVPIEENEAPLADSIDHELKKLNESSPTVSLMSSVSHLYVLIL